MDAVLIVGAGPTGLALALWLDRHRVKVRIIDRSAAPGTASRAVVIHARTLELYRQLGLAERMVAAGHVSDGIHFWAEGERRADLVFGAAGTGMTPYPYVLILPQDRHEQLLVEALAQRGIAVERETELVGLEEQADHVLARLRDPDSQERSVAVRYLAGCDGAHSAVRHALGLAFEGGTYEHVFYVADVQAAIPAPTGDAHFALDRGDFVAVFPYNEHGHVRLIGAVRDAAAAAADTPLRYEDVQSDALHSLGVEVTQVNWFSTYRVHHRIASRFRQGRCFLLGDAAHVHSPAGGQGMNTGIADAANLAWKLAAVLRQEADERLLDTYEAERRAFALQLVATTDRAFTLVTRTGRLAELVKDHVAPAVLAAVFANDHLRRRAFGLVSQTALAYPDSPLSTGRAGTLHGGDRFPWIAGEEGDSFALLQDGVWVAYACGLVPEQVRAWCVQHGVQVHEAPWTAAQARAGCARGALYLVRPDMYVGLALPHPEVAALEAYIQKAGCLLPVS